MPSKGLITISWASKTGTKPLVSQGLTFGAVERQVSSPPYEMRLKEITLPVPVGVPHSTRNLWYCSPTPFSKPPQGSPHLLWQLLLCPLTMCQHVAFCTSDCHSSVPGEGAPPSLHPAVIATVQGFHQAGHASYCWRLESKVSWWLRAQPHTAAPKPCQPMSPVPLMPYLPVPTA